MDPTQTILIVTGTDFDLAGLELALARHAFRVQVVNKGDSALEAVEAGHIALALLDVAIAGSASFELCQRLSSHHNGRRLPVLLMSARPCDEEQQRAALAGADGYIRMPFSSSAVVEKILLLTGSHSGPPLLGTLEVNYHMMMAGSPDAIILLDADSGYPIDVNLNAERLFGRSAEELIALPLLSLCPPLQPDSRTSAAVLMELVERVAAGEIRVYQLSLLHSSGHQIDCEVRMILIDKDGRRLLHMRLVDVTGQLLAEALREGQNRLLEMVARGAPLQATLDALVQLIEAQTEGVICSVMLLDESGTRMRCGSAPNLPRDYLVLLEGREIGPMVGSCGTAMFRREAVIVSDIESDPLWEPYRALVAPFGLKACWSMPILMDENTVLGSFAMYYRAVRHPTAADQRLIGVASHLAGIAIERTRAEAELHRHRAKLEELVRERTAELTQAQQALVQRDKLAALGTLVAGVAHELNTPIGNSLMVVSTMSDHTAEMVARLEQGLRRSELVEYVKQAGEADAVLLRNLSRAANLISSFKEIAVDVPDAQRREFVLDEFVAQLMLPLYAAVKQPRPQLVQDIPPDLRMRSYPGQLGQAITNLFANCLLHAFPAHSDGVITIAARVGEPDQMLLTVSDNGVGIPPENLRRVFDPFFTTRLGAGSSGLGLHIVHNIVTGVLGGQIDVESKPGQGSRFTMRLPMNAPL
ncbi:ATP-binding protein [Pseudoduganella sp. RAF19]|uniref:ATP-binding protein n=2 Tax=unclassified Pseudoduganella TaxID=2637179 RepID=UPI003F957445